MQKLRSSLHYMWLLFVINTKAALALRGSFISASFFMFINNLIFFVTWLIIFTRVDSIGGWSLLDCSLMYGLVAIAFGAAVVFAGGLTNLARTISDGELDAFLTQPKPVLCSALGSRTNVSGWGDIVSGLLLVALSGYLHPLQLLFLLITSICAAVIFLMCGLLLHSCAFWLGPVNPLARQMHEFLLTFSLYPGPIYTGWLRVAVFTVVPAGFISAMPVELIRDFSFSQLAIVCLATLIYSRLGLWVFNRGLWRYESGNRMIVRA